MTNINYSKSTIKIGTFFSGIGSPEKALQRLKTEGRIKDFKLEFFSEIDKDAIKSYCAIHNVDKELNLGNITEIRGCDLPYCDLWVGGFPCQDISCAGKMKGFDFNSSTRSSLGWEMIRLLKEVSEKPRFVIFENVANITSKAFKETLELFKNDLMELGYTLYDNVLNAIDYGVPQTRRRYFLIAILNNHKKFKFPSAIKNDLTMKDYLEKDVAEKYYLTNENFDELPNNKRLFHKINRDDIEYEIDMEKYKLGGCCGKDKKCKFAISSRVFSSLGNAPTLTANNTADNCKIVVESGVI